MTASKTSSQANNLPSANGKRKIRYAVVGGTNYRASAC